VDDKPVDIAAPPFRFGVRGMLLSVAVICIVFGMFWFVSLVLLLLGGVLLAQCLFFLVIQRFVITVGGSPDPIVDGDEPGNVHASTAR
jgi:hypothetical protein